MSKQSLRIWYDPALKEVRFKRFRDSEEIAISEVSRLRKYMRKRGNFILQDEKYEVEFLNDIAMAFEGEKEIDIEIITTKKDFEYFAQMVSRYNENREDKCLIKEKFIGETVNPKKICSEYCKKCNNRISALKRKIAAIDKVIDNAEIEFAVPKNNKPSLSEIISLGLSGSAQERIISKVEAYLDEKLTGIPEKKEAEYIRGQVNEITDKFRTDFLEKLEKIIKRKESKCVNQLKKIIKNNDMGNTNLGTDISIGELPVAEFEYDSDTGWAGLFKDTVKEIKGTGVVTSIFKIFAHNDKEEYINMVTTSARDFLKKQSDAYGKIYCKVLKAKLKDIRKTSEKIKDAFSKEIEIYNKKKETVERLKDMKSENLLQEIQNYSEDFKNMF